MAWVLENRVVWREHINKGISSTKTVPAMSRQAAGPLLAEPQPVCARGAGGDGAPQGLRQVLARGQGREPRPKPLRRGPRPAGPCGEQRWRGGGTASPTWRTSSCASRGATTAACSRTSLRTLASAWPAGAWAALHASDPTCCARVTCMPLEELLSKSFLKCTGCWSLSCDVGFASIKHAAAAGTLLHDDAASQCQVQGTYAGTQERATCLGCTTPLMHMRLNQLSTWQAGPPARASCSPAPPSHSSPLPSPPPAACALPHTASFSVKGPNACACPGSADCFSR